jgi:SAM-dependent methyltransferase
MRNPFLMNESNWSEEQIKKMLQEHDFSYQNIELPYGLSTGGADRSSTVQKIFPDDMAGKSILDVGSKYGYFCFEALKRGADRVMGIEVDPDTVRKARMLADCLGVKASFELLDIEVDPIHETFDYVLCLNLLHHLRNPLSTLEKLTLITREQLILEVAALGRHDRKKVDVSLAQRFFLNRSPVIFVNNSGVSGKKRFQKFFITSSAIEHLLLYQRNHFARVETLPSDHKDRYISVAHKRRIGKLVVVAGPTAAGKSTLIKRLRRNEAPEVAEKVGIEDGTTWTTIDANKLTTLTEPFVEKLILHYDFLRPYLRSTKVPERDEVLDLLRSAEHLTFLTIWCPQQLLRERLEKGEIAPKTKNGVYRGNKRHLLLSKEYEDPVKVRTHYQNWIEYTRTKPGDHIVVSLTDEVRCWSVAEWEKLEGTERGNKL